MLKMLPLMGIDSIDYDFEDEDKKVMILWDEIETHFKLDKAA